MRALRTEHGLTQERAAELARLDAKQLRAIETGEPNVTIATLHGLAKCLRVTLSELLDGV